MNEIWFCGQKNFLTFIGNKLEKTTKLIEIEIENENENQNENQIKQISSSDFSLIILFKNGKAIEHFKESNQNPEKIQIENIKKVDNGIYNVCVLTAEGNVFAKGEYIKEEFPNKFFNISSLIEDPNDRIIDNIVCGLNQIYLLTSSQNVYGIGSNEFGQLGVDLDTFKYTEKPVLMMENVSKIFSAKFSFSVFLLNSNQELFGCGYNHYGQLGLGFKNKISPITKLKNIPKGKIIDIQMGYFHSIMLIESQNEKRKLYSCGFYESNGLGDKREDTKEFTEIKSSLFENDDYILEVSCGNSHTLILTSNSKLIAFGINLFGQLGSGNIESQSIPIQIELPKLSFDISNYHLSCGPFNSFIYSSFSSSLEEDLIKLFKRKEFCDISFKTRNGEIVEAHKLILRYRLKDENQIEKLQEIISKKSVKESNQIFEMIYSNKRIASSYLEVKEIIKEETIEETMKRIYLNENEKDFIIERKEKKYKFPKLILIMRSELYRGMFLSVTEDKSNKVTDYSELSNEAFQILEYWIYSNQIKDEIKKINKKIIEEIKRGIDYFQLNQTKPNLLDLLINKFNN
ncbi:btk-binding protein-related [Anaeramoeba ignava]|uniref:Btk-binding protein-related n=1 Tax=Anaeramoeba ignava TaxID=1746090 RepID=A0A9Q0R5Z0_ANAIG|nr:btk-binding protein-related [Anaeramoeba ignava]